MQERLETDARIIVDLQRQVTELTARFRTQAMPTPQLPLAERFNVQQPRGERPDDFHSVPRIAPPIASLHPLGWYYTGSVACCLPKRLGNW